MKRPDVGDRYGRKKAIIAGCLLISVLLDRFGFAAIAAFLFAAGGMLYPTEFRAKGLGWAFSAGRLGSVLGPLIGGTWHTTMKPRGTIRWKT